MELFGRKDHQKQEEPWSDMQTISTAREHLGTQLLLGLGSDFQINGSMSPNKESESVQVKAELSSSDPAVKDNFQLEGTVSDKSSSLKIYEAASHRLLEELNCDQNSCRRTDANGKLISTRDFKNQLEKVHDEALNTDLEFWQNRFLNRKSGHVFVGQHEDVGAVSLNNSPHWANLAMLVAGRDRTFYQKGEYENGQSKEKRSLDITYTYNSGNEVSFEGKFERKQTP